MKALLYRLLGHDWQPVDPIRYEYGEAKAYTCGNPESRTVSVAWVNDERCARCGAEQWWPS